MPRGCVAWVLFVAGATCVTSAQAPSSPGPARHSGVNVLALYSDDRLLYANQQIEAGFRQVLASEGQGVRFFGEFMDAVRFPSARSHDVLRQYLADKYRDTPPRVLVAAGLPALEFLMAQRQVLFPGVPIVFEGVSDRELSRVALDAQVVGVPGSWDLGLSLDLALRLQPDTTHVVVINGVSPRERLMLGTVPERATALHPALTFTWLTQHTLDDIVAAVKALGPRTIVLFGSLMEDAAGAVRAPRDALEDVAQASAVPVYGQFESYVGYGVVGSRAETWHDTGAEAARLVMGILDGGDPQAVAAGRRMPISTIVDWQQVIRWGLTSADFPPDTATRFREPTIWQSHRTLILAFAAIGVVQLSMILALLNALRRRRVAEERRMVAQERATRLRNELAHATRVATLGELTAALAHDINQPLAAILSNAQAARRWLLREPPDLDEVRGTVDDIIANGKRAGAVVHDVRAMLTKSPAAQTRANLGRVTADVATLLHGEFVANGAAVELVLPDAPVEVDVNVVEIQQVLVNLMLNAVQAVRANVGTPRHVRVELHAADGMARVVVRDTGPGVTDEARAHLFQPFFTTKVSGLGMGLAICRRIAESHHGSLDLTESTHAGAAFTLRLPLAPEAR